MQWLEKSSGFTQVQGLGSFKSTLTRLYATHHSFCLPEPRQIKPRALGVILPSTSKSRRLGCCNSGDVLDQKTTLTQYICWCLSFHDVRINFLGFIVGLISRCCCSRRASVERSLCLKWLTMSFPMSSILATLFLNFADDALQVTSPKAPFCDQNFSWRLRLCSLEENATLLQRCGAWWRKLRSRSSHVTKFLRDLLARVAPKKERKKKRVQANGSNLQVLLNKFAHSVAKARWRVRRKGDWKEIAKLKAKYSILDLQLAACAAAVSFVATALRCSLAWIYRAPTDAAFHSCRSAQTHFFFAQRMFVKAKRMFVTATNELLPNVR